MSAVDTPSNMTPVSGPMSAYSTPQKSGATGSRRGSLNGAAAAALLAAQPQPVQPAQPSASTLVITPFKSARILRSRPLSRDNSREALQQQHADPLAPAATAALAAAAAVSSPAQSSLTTTSIFSTSGFQPHPPGSPAPAVALIATTTTSYSTPSGGGGGGGQRPVADDTKLHSVSLPAVGATHAQPAPSHTAALLAAANKESASPQLTISALQLPQIVQAQQSRLTALESLTTSQGESIVELQRIIRNLQKQLVFVMAAVPSTSGTGGVSSLSPALPSRSLHPSDSPVLPYRSRSSTELRYARQQQSSKRLSSGGSSAVDRIVAGMNVGSHSESMDSLPNSHRSHISTSRPTSKTNSRYNSPRGNSAAATTQQASHGSTAFKASSHHFSFHPTTPSTQPPPGQLHVDHSVGIVATRTPAGSKGRTRLQVGQSATHQSQSLSPRDPGSGVRPSRRLTPVEGFGAALGAAAFDSHAVPAAAAAAAVAPQQSTTTATISIGHAHATISATTYPSRPGQPGQQQLHQQHQQQQQHQSQLHPPFSPGASPPTPSALGQASPGSVSSLDGTRPLPVQHTVTRSKHGVTEYVLSFRDGQAVDPVHDPAPHGYAGEALYDEGANGSGGGDSVLLHQQLQQQQLQLHADHSSGGEYREPSPRSAALDLWKAQQLQAAAAAGRKEKKSGSSRRIGTSGAAPPGSTAIDVQRHAHRRVRSTDAPTGMGGEEEDPALPTGATAAALLAAKRARKKERERERETRKVCKVAGCGEARSGPDSKYCRAHSGPAPLNPNARKMMFQH